MIDKNAQSFVLDETIMQLEKTLNEALKVKVNNRHFTKIGKFVGALNGDYKRMMNANKLFLTTLNDIVRYLIIDMGVPNIRVFMIYYSNRLVKFLKAAYPLAKVYKNEEAMKNFILKMNKKGKITEFTVNENNEFVINR